jgi:CDP-6-deoxy-D-xylo-4-hexulose-3-dehydrase
MLFGGNLLRQPAFMQLREDNPEALRVIGTMASAHETMNNTLCLGTYLGLSIKCYKRKLALFGVSFAL